jgi:hypothetical protein
MQAIFHSNGSQGTQATKQLSRERKGKTDNENYESPR